MLTKIIETWRERAKRKYEIAKVSTTQRARRDYEIEGYTWERAAEELEHQLGFYKLKSDRRLDKYIETVEGLLFPQPLDRMAVRTAFDRGLSPEECAAVLKA
jgi:hypothetical protein